MDFVNKLVLRIYKTELKQIFLTPVELCKNLKTEPPAEAVARTLVYGVAAGLISFMWGLVRLNLNYGIQYFLVIALVSVPVLFIGAGIFFLLNKLLNGKEDFHLDLTVTSWLMAFYPGALIVSELILKTKNPGIIVNLVFSVYFLYVAYQVMIHTFKADKTRVHIFYGLIAGYFLVSLFFIY